MYLISCLFHPLGVYFHHFLPHSLEFKLYESKNHMYLVYSCILST